MSALTELFEIAMRQANLIDSLVILGIEYEKKAIAPERFAERVHELLCKRLKRDSNGAVISASREP